MLNNMREIRAVLTKCWFFLLLFLVALGGRASANELQTANLSISIKHPVTEYSDFTKSHWPNSSYRIPPGYEFYRISLSDKEPLLSEIKVAFGYQAKPLLAKLAPLGLLLLLPILICLWKR